MIRLDFIKENNIRFDETRYANDAMFSLLVGCKAADIKAVDKPLYVVTEGDSVLCRNFFNKPGEALVRCKVFLRLNKVIE